MLRRKEQELEDLRVENRRLSQNLDETNPNVGDDCVICMVKPIQFVT